ncbi:uncharacterized protein LOC130449577 isoform X1 [Diorhabda sublineata]|uniref:uncharacterized protein LOC130449577 isoform X1 n=2 Tax=Diorhabda sublineata TaxID=1163346 RepID=UPI0024E11F5F|nr:uncharacterized protein LOC130449577 isoform X1 [Diorhabda sublineata]
MEMNASNVNVTVNVTGLEEETYNALSDITLFYKIYLELYTILSILCIIANSLLMFVILKHRRLRKEKENIILLNWCVLNTFFMVTQPATFRIEMYWTGIWRYTTFCVLEQTEYTALFGDVILIELLFLYWFLKMYYPRASRKLSAHLHFVLIIVYVLFVTCVALHIGTCVRRSRGYAEVILVLSYSIFLLFMIVMNITHLVKRRKLVQTTPVSNVPYILSNIFFLAVFPLLVVGFVGLFIEAHYFLIISLVNISLFLSIMNPIYFFVTLYKFDNNYNTFLGYVLRCKCNQYGNDEMQEEPVVYNTTVQIS